MFGPDGVYSLDLNQRMSIMNRMEQTPSQQQALNCTRGPHCGPLELAGNPWGLLLWTPEPSLCSPFICIAAALSLPSPPLPVWSMEEAALEYVVFRLIQVMCSVFRAFPWKSPDEWCEWDLRLSFECKWCCPLHPFYCVPRKSWKFKIYKKVQLNNLGKH